MKRLLYLTLVPRSYVRGWERGYPFHTVNDESCMGCERLGTRLQANPHLEWLFSVQIKCVASLPSPNHCLGNYIIEENVKRIIDMHLT